VAALAGAQAVLDAEHGQFVNAGLPDDTARGLADGWTPMATVRCCWRRERDAADPGQGAGAAEIVAGPLDGRPWC
jgi:DNA ligase (NAD+)